MSRRRTTSPFWPVLTTTSPNSSSFSRRPCVFSASWNSEPSAGGAPIWPAATCRFCSRIGADHVAGGEVARGHLLRIEPHAHGVVAGAEHAHVAHAVQARERVADVQRGVVAQIQGVVAAVGRGQVHHHEERRRALERGHADGAHFFGQARQRLRHAVLHLHLGAVDVRADAEGDGQRQRAVHRRLRGHVEHVLDADDFLLERRGHRFGDDLGIGAGVGGAHHHRGRHHFRVLADG